MGGMTTRKKMVGAPKPKVPKEATRKLFCNILGAEFLAPKRRCGVDALLKI
jgi:hypothetical protein